MNVKNIQQKQLGLSGGSLRIKWGWLFALGWFSKVLIWKSILEMALHKDVLCILKSVLLGLDLA